MCHLWQTTHRCGPSFRDRSLLPLQKIGTATVFSSDTSDENGDSTVSNGQFQVGVLKIGCIASSPFIDLILDERADRDISTRSWSTGAKMDEKASLEVAKMLTEHAPNLAIIVSPNASLPGPRAARKALNEASIPFISISDGPSQKAFFKKDKDGKKETSTSENEGFIVIPSDPMIGARREFLDSVEMVLFNSDVLKVLSICGIVRGTLHLIDSVVNQMKAGKPAEMPRMILDPMTATEYAGLSNSYAIAKALAALRIAESTAKVTSEACFKEQDQQRYIIQAAAGHEMIRAAAKLADEAREIEKSSDSVIRTPHAKDGRTLQKKKLDEKPK
jgi:methylenetetrahydromethanopterin dehydrogenase